MHKARFVAYINLVISFLLLALTIRPTVVAYYFGYAPSVSIYSSLFFLVMMVWGTANAVRFLRRPGLGKWDKFFLLLAPVNLIYLLVIVGVLWAMN